MKLNHKALLFFFFLALPAFAGIISRITTFQDGNVLTGSQLNSEFNNILDLVNGNLDNDNISDTANIDSLKIEAAIADAGIARDGTTGVLSVNTDNSTLEVSGDTVRMKDDGTTGAKLAAAVAGSGLVQDGSGNLDVNPDNSTIEINTDALRVKDSGITSAKILDGTVTGTDIANNTIGQTDIGTDAVDSDEIASGAVGSDEIATDAVTGPKLALYDSHTINASSSCSTTSTATCFSGTIAPTGNGGTLIMVTPRTDGSAAGTVYPTSCSGSMTCRVFIRLAGSVVSRWEMSVCSGTTAITFPANFTFYSNNLNGSTSYTVELARVSGGDTCNMDNVSWTAVSF